MVALGAAALVLSPALAIVAQRHGASMPAALSARSFGDFTPAVSDPRLAAALAERRTRVAGLRLTPAAVTREATRPVRLAIRARATTPAQAARDAATPAPAAATVAAITPSSYSLGMSVGWRRFAVTGDVQQDRDSVVPGTRDAAQVGVNYRATPRLTTRVEVEAERSLGVQRVVGADQAYALDVGGSYRIGRNLDVTGGVRYRIQRDRLEPLARDERRDSQAVYVGTAFRF